MKIIVIKSIFLIYFFGITILNGQVGSLSVKVDKDTIYHDEVIKVEFIMENLTGNFKLPNFRNFRIVSGPNTSSSFTMINGEVTQKKSYSYILLPELAGDLEIESAELESEDVILHTDPLHIFVFDVAGSSGNKFGQDRIYKYESTTPSSNIPKVNTKKRVLKRI